MFEDEEMPEHGIKEQQSNKVPSMDMFDLSGAGSGAPTDVHMKDHAQKDEKLSAHEQTDLERKTEANAKKKAHGQEELRKEQEELRKDAQRREDEGKVQTEINLEAARVAKEEKAKAGLLNLQNAAKDHV